MTLQQLQYAVTIAETGSMNEAAKQLFITQPSLSGSIKELENDLGVTIFSRTNKGVALTSEGREFMGYARSVLGQMDLLLDRYQGQTGKKKFGVSTQHYSFAVNAFVQVLQKYDMGLYEFAIRETRTADIILDVASGRSEIGILYKNDFNEKVMDKLLKSYELSFVPMFTCKGFVYLWKNHPLASKKKITLKDLEDYPCLSFEQGDTASLQYAEEILSTYDYKKTIKACDRATMLNLMVGVNAYTLCSGIICEELNGEDCIAVPLDVEVKMNIGYITRKKVALSTMGEEYISAIRDYVTPLLPPNDIDDSFNNWVPLKMNNPV